MYFFFMKLEQYCKTKILPPRNVKMLKKINVTFVTLCLTPPSPPLRRTFAVLVIQKTLIPRRAQSASGIIITIMEVFNLSVIPKRIDYNTGATEALCFGKFLCWITERD